jgi:hypothetical protein
MKNFGILAAVLVASCVVGSAQNKPKNVTVGKTITPNVSTGTGVTVQPGSNGQGTAVAVPPKPTIVSGGENPATAAQPNVNAKLEIIGGDTYDWKKVKPKDTPLKAKIQIINKGTELLKISEVRPGCGCTAAPIDKKELKPMTDTATIEVSLNLGTSSGPLSKSITITSNDGTSPNKVLYLKADVIREINITPSPYFAFSNMSVGKTSEATVRLENNSDKDLVIKEATATNGIEINVKPGTTIKSKTTLEVMARVTPKDKGYFTASAKILTSHPDYETIDMTAYGNVKGADAIVAPGVK